jgi:hypothetical protein
VPAIATDRIRCRGIRDEDLEAVVAFLGTGFEGRDPAYWRNGLAILKRRSVPHGYQRYGLMLERGGREIVGIVLLIASERKIEGADAVFVNIAGWYVARDFRSFAQPLISAALRHKDATYLNVSPATHTWHIVEKQGYERYCNGLFFALAALSRPVPKVTVEAIGADGPDIPEARLLREHAEYGCISLVCRENGRVFPFVFRPYRIRSGRLWTPAAMTIYSRNCEDIVRFGGNLGRFLTRKFGLPVIVTDADGPIPGLRGLFTARRGRKYFKGPHRPRLCDLAYTEFAIFGV